MECYRSRSVRRQNGFTLVEMMVTVAIIAILSRIAYVSYIKQVIKSNRSGAEAELVQMAASMERSFAVSDKYPSTINSIGSLYKYYPTSGTSVYVMAIATNNGGATYTLTATPSSSSKNLNRTDGLLQLKSDGTKCWDKDNSGSCSTSEMTWNQ